MQPTRDDHELAAALAVEAGRRLVALRSEHDPGSVRGAAGDRASDDYLLAELARLRPDDGVLSEETADDGRRLAQRRVWIVDPLDGTREYSEEGRADWAVHVALAIDGVPLAGAVALPAENRCFATASPTPRVEAPAHRRLKLVVSRSRPPALAGAVAAALGADLVELGSAGAKVMAVVRGDVDLYVHAGGMYEWDSCAPVAVALGAGYHASRLDGSPLRYNNADPFLPDLLVCHPALASAALNAIVEAQR